MPQALRPQAYRCWIQNTRKNLAERHIQLYSEETTFMIYRADTNAVMATGVKGFEEAKRRANALRASNNLKWDQVKFKAERQSSQRGTFGVSGSGRSLRMDLGEVSQLITLGVTTHQKGADSVGIMMIREIIMILIRYLLRMSRVVEQVFFALIVANMISMQ